MNRLTLLAILSISGVLFSGYLSGVKLFSESCAFNEPCPFFLGYPACYFGFALFLALAILALQHRLRGLTERAYLKAVAAVSLLGVLFAGYFTIPELSLLIFYGSLGYALGLPTCSYGLLVFLAVFGISLRALFSAGGSIRRG